MKRAFFAAVLPVAVAAATPANAVEVLAEGFDDVSTLAGKGWVVTNQSVPLGVTEWFQGGLLPSSQSGSDTSYITSNFLATDFLGGDLSDWLISPEFSTATGGRVTFWVLGAADSGYKDELAFGFSSGSANTASFVMSAPQVAPQDNWTQFSFSFAAAGPSSIGRFAIAHVGRGETANYVGVDTFNVDVNAAGAVPETAAWMMMIFGFGLVGAALRCRNVAVSFA